MNLQEVFNTAYRGLHAQQFRRAFNEVESCQYRALSGDRCAIGHCIPDDVYDDSMDRGGSLGVSGLRDAYPAADNLFAGLDTNSLERLQSCHDDAISPAEMRQMLRDFATEQNLTVPQTEGDDR